MYRKTVLDHGLRIISERLPHSRLASLGIWVDVGSRDEHDLNNGTAHFIEHMLFKGTGRRSGEQIARELDVLGGAANAFTSRDTTCYYATVLDRHLPVLIDLLADIFFNSCFAQQEVAREQQVILQEISMVEDMPEDQVHDLFTSLLWGRHPLANTVLGGREVVAAMDSKKLIDYFRKFYTPGRIIIAAAGNIDHDDLVACWSKAAGRGLPAPDAGEEEQRHQPTLLEPRRAVFNKPLEQVHLLLGTCGLSARDPERYGFLLLNVLLGGNMSSRLFQELREKHGLAYSIYSYVSSYLDCGNIGVYLGVDQGSVNESLSRAIAEINRLKQETVPDPELTNAKEYVKAGLYLAAESMEAIMMRIARNELVHDRYVPFAEVAAAIDRVTAEDIGRLAERVFASDMTMAALGPLNSSDVDWALLTH
ncbi:MAG: insulinase family protein [Desulfobacterales bacterium]|nr:insulinase family protein [Desulfobacterales bacterium]